MLARHEGLNAHTDAVTYNDTIGKRRCTAAAAAAAVDNWSITIVVSGRLAEETGS
jgi:hypothetical protein